MPSQARISLDENLGDIKKLLELHKKESGEKKGRRFGLEVLNKSAIVLLCAFWEAYCEDIAAEALEHLVKNVKDFNQLPEKFRKDIAKEIKESPNELAVWQMAGSGWRKYMTSRLTALQVQRNRNLNTPNADNIDKLFNASIGIPRISDSWNLTKRTSAEKARENLNRLVGLRGNIAHRGRNLKTVKKADVKKYYEFIHRLAARTGGRVNGHVRKITKTGLWT